MDALIAEKVMGLKLCQCYGQKPNERDSTAKCFDCKCPESSPKYSTSIEVAWEVVSELIKYSAFKDHFELKPIDKGWICNFFGSAFVAHGETAPHAICLAALNVCLPIENRN